MVVCQEGMESSIPRMGQGSEAYEAGTVLVIHLKTRAAA